MHLLAPRFDPRRADPAQDGRVRGACLQVGDLGFLLVVVVADHLRRRATAAAADTLLRWWLAGVACWAAAPRALAGTLQHTASWAVGMGEESRAARPNSDKLTLWLSTKYRLFSCLLVFAFFVSHPWCSHWLAGGGVRDVCTCKTSAALVLRCCADTLSFRPPNTQLIPGNSLHLGRVCYT